MNNIYVLGVDMENRGVEEVARDAATQIVELLDRLVEEQERIKSTNSVGIISKEENEKCKKKDSISGIDQTDSDRVVRNCESRAEFVAVVGRLIETVTIVRKYAIHTHLR